MKSIKFIQTKLTKEISSRLIELSRMWFEENCSHGMIVNEVNDLKEPLVIALNDDEIIGYCFGHYFIQENTPSYIENGRKCFSVDEIYVIPQFRGKGVGKELIKRIEEIVYGSCEYITIATSTKNYKAILRFYVDELDYDFHSALVIKKTS